MSLRTLSAGVFALGLMAAVCSAQGSPILAMGEVPTQPVNGLTVNGVTFHFTIGGIASNDANINAANGGQGFYVQDPSLEGNALGLLTMTLAAPTTYLQFGVIRSTAGSLPAGAIVRLFTPSGTLLGTFTVPTTTLIGFTEGLFVANGIGLIGQAAITFPNAAAASRFAIDNVVVYSFPRYLWFFH